MKQPVQGASESVLLYDAKENLVISDSSGEQVAAEPPAWADVNISANLGHLEW